MYIDPIIAYLLFTALNIYGVEAAASFELIVTVIAVVTVAVLVAVVLAEKIEDILAHIGRVKTVEIKAGRGHQVPEACWRETLRLQAVQRQCLGRLAHIKPGGLVSLQFCHDAIRDLLNGAHGVFYFQYVDAKPPHLDLEISAAQVGE